MEPILSVKGLTKRFNQDKSSVLAVDNISFQLFSGDCLGIVGESGCGKSTTVNLITRLKDADGGKIILNGMDITSAKGKSLRSVYQKMQMVFQFPQDSFNPHQKLNDAIIEPLINKGMSKREAKKQLPYLLDLVGLDLSLINNKYSYELSGVNARIREAYAAIPRLSEIDSEIAALSLKKARILLSRRTGPDFDLSAAIGELSEERTALLLANGYSADFLDLHYDCPLCRDTGFADGRKCACFRRAETELLYEQSNLKEILLEDNFEHFSLQYYSDEAINESSGLSARQTAAFALKCAREFVAGFSDSFTNLCFYGDTGVGKTFLSHCIAKELIEAGFSVLYLTAFEFFEQLEQHKFSSSDESEEAYRHLFECDLLIIDDLGTELTNSFVSSSSFCVSTNAFSGKNLRLSPRTFRWSNLQKPIPSGLFPAFSAIIR